MADPNDWIVAERAATHLAVRVLLERRGSAGAVPRLHSARTVYELFRRLADEDREVFLVCLLDTKQKVTGVQVASVGTLDASLVHPREVFKAAIVANAASVICVHNHPSGDPRPSREDHDITARLRDAGRLLGIPLLDHVVVGLRGYTSFADRGWL